MATSRLSMEEDQPDQPNATVETIDEQTVARAPPDDTEVAQRTRARTPTEDARTSTHFAESSFPVNAPSQTDAPAHDDADAHNVTISTGSVFRERSGDYMERLESVPWGQDMTRFEQP